MYLHAYIDPHNIRMYTNAHTDNPKGKLKICVVSGPGMPLHSWNDDDKQTSHMQ